MPAAYRETPLDTTGYPPGIPYIVGNEAAERFSFWGMKAVLAVYMTEHLKRSDGTLAVMSDDEARFAVHLFFTAVFLFFPLLGAIVADAFLGKYRTIIVVSLVYCLGHVALALDETRLGLAVGLSLIAFGAGALKPCVAAHVGDQFGRANQHLLEKVFGWFYLSTNVGAAASMFLTPLLLDRYGPHWAFGVPAILMFLSTIVFWMGRHRYAHIPPAGTKAVLAAFDRDGWQAIRGLIPIYLFLAVFWSLYDQNGSAWVLQAKRMDLAFAGVMWLPAQLQAVNPVLILLFVPLFSHVVYPLVSRNLFVLTPLRKMSVGFFVTVLAFTVTALIEVALQSGRQPTIGWQLLAYVLMTAAEVLVVISCLEFTYTQAPNRLKSLVMSIFLMSIGVGNAFTTGVNYFNQRPDGTSRLAGADYYWFFTGLMAAAAVAFIVTAALYRPRHYVQGTDG